MKKSNDVTSSPIIATNPPGPLLKSGILAAILQRIIKQG